MTSGAQGPGAPGDRPGRTSPPGPGEAREEETVRLPDGVPPPGDGRPGSGDGGSRTEGSGTGGSAPAARNDLTYSATVLDHAWGSVTPGPGPAPVSGPGPGPGLVPGSEPGLVPGPGAEPESAGNRAPDRGRGQGRDRDEDSEERTQVLPVTGPGAFPDAGAEPEPEPGPGPGTSPGPDQGSPRLPAFRSGGTGSPGPGRAGPPFPPDGVLRFGPGVPARARPSGAGAPAGGSPYPQSPPPGSPPAGPWHGGPSPHRPPPAHRGPRWPRRYAPAALILLCVAVFLLWDRQGPDFAVTGVTVRASGPGGCDATADVVARVRTNGQSGTIRYRWLRSDGTSSGPLRERLARGQREARLRLKWTFRGEGTVRATAELRITSPDRRTESAAFTYRCG